MKHILFAILPFILFMSCNDNKSLSDHNNTSEDSTVIHLGVTPTLDCLPLYVADQRGIFDSLGLRIKLITFNAAMDCDTAFSGGTVEGLMSDIVKANIWRSQGDSITVVMSPDMPLYLVTSKSSRLRRAESLKERIVAITRNSALDLCADKILESVKLTSQELNKPQINNINLRAKMLDQNQYDGAILPEPHASLCAANGGRRLIGTSDFGLSLGALIFHEKFVNAHQEEVELIIKAYDKAVDKINKDLHNGKKGEKESGKGQTSLLSYIPGCEHVNDTLVTILPFKHASLPTDSMINIAKDWAKGRGLLKSNVKNEDLTTPSVRP